MLNIPIGVYKEEVMFGLFKRTNSVSTNELASKWNGKMTLLDVRTPNEFRAGHIPFAKNVPLNNIAGYKGKDNQDIYVICQSGMRSKQAANILKKNGYNVINVRGGMNQWTGSVKGGK